MALAIPIRFFIFGLVLMTGPFLANERPAAHASFIPRPKQATPGELNCVSVFGEARYGAFAYNHIVRIANGCAVEVACTVATDVNPEPQSVTIAPGQAVEVVTFLGSPARTFTPVVRCTRTGASSYRDAR